MELHQVPAQYLLREPVRQRGGREWAGGADILLKTPNVKEVLASSVEASTLVVGFTPQSNTSHRSTSVLVGSFKRHIIYMFVSGLSFHIHMSTHFVEMKKQKNPRLFSLCCCPLLLLCDCHLVHHASNDLKAFGRSPQISLQLLAEAQAGYRFLHFKWDCLAHLKFHLQPERFQMIIFI